MPLLKCDAECVTLCLILQVSHLESELILHRQRVETVQSARDSVQALLDEARAQSTTQQAALTREQQQVRTEFFKHKAELEESNIEMVKMKFYGDLGAHLNVVARPVTDCNKCNFRYLASVKSASL